MQKLCMKSAIKKCPDTAYLYSSLIPDQCPDKLFTSLESICCYANSQSEI